MGLHRQRLQDGDQPQSEWAEEFSEGLAAFENENGKHGYLDETGRVVISQSLIIDAVSKDLRLSRLISNGATSIRRPVAIPAQFAVGRSFSDGLHPSSAAKRKVSFTWTREACLHRQDRQGCREAKDDTLNGLSRRCRTVQFVTNHASAVLIGWTGKIIVSVQDLHRVSEGPKPAKQNRKWGYLVSGRFAIEPQFEEASSRAWRR